MRILSDEEERYGVSTELTLYKDPWTMKKTLNASDIGDHSRIILHTNFVEENIIKYLSDDIKITIEAGLPMTVNVYDHDTHKTSQLVFKKYNSSGSYVLNGGWRPLFVHGRGLKKGDTIGLFWDRFAFTFHFRVLSRAAN